MNTAIKTTLITCSLFGGILTTSSAFACGGFFCDAGSPVNQAAERIIFAKNRNGTITQVVEVQYDGPSENFAWILPVPGTPDVNVSSSIVLDRLQGATNPTYQLNTRFDEFCFGEDGDGDGDTDGGGDFESGELAPIADNARPPVSVIDSGSVGPYNYETISVAESSDEPAQLALEWLEENGYDISGTTTEVLSPYLESGLNLIAFRLQSDQSAGAIRPISLNYQSERASIPIVPTSVAANDDMGIMVWVLGQTRAVPINYYGLELNEAQIDWFNPGPTYNEVVTAAANEAGGHGFVTEMAAPTEEIISNLQSLKVSDDTIGRIPSGLEFALEELSFTFNGFDGFIDVMNEYVSLRDGVSIEEFLSCTSCYFNPGQRGPFFEDNSLPNLPPSAMMEEEVAPDEEISDEDPIFQTDLTAILAALEEEVIKPVNATVALFEMNPYFSRLYTTMSAEEMDEDPIFDFNTDLTDVSRIHRAEQLFNCDDEGWEITLPNGTVLYGKGFEWPLNQNDDDAVFNLRVLSFGTQGAPVVERDNGSLIDQQLITAGVGAPNSEGTGNSGGLASGDPEAQDGCSYQAGPSSKSWLYSLLGFAALALFWRKRRA